MPAGILPISLSCRELRSTGEAGHAWSTWAPYYVFYFLIKTYSPFEAHLLMFFSEGNSFRRSAKGTVTSVQRQITLKMKSSLINLIRKIRHKNRRPEIINNCDYLYVAWVNMAIEKWAVFINRLHLPPAQYQQVLHFVFSCEKRPVANHVQYGGIYMTSIYQVYVDVSPAKNLILFFPVLAGTKYVTYL